MAGHHILWVDHEGNVFIDLLPPDKAPAWWGYAYEGKYKFRWETFVRGNGYVGKEVSNDFEYIESQLKALLNDWKQNKGWYVDF